jgi:type IV pilus assembly protein PilB
LEELQRTFPNHKGEFEILRGKGCANCKYTGYRGRVAIFEMMVMTDELRSMTVKQAPANEIRDRAIAEGMITLRRDGWAKAIEGKTSVEEVVTTAPLRSKYQ